MSNTAAPSGSPAASHLILAALFSVAGIAHFVVPSYFMAIVPPALPNPALLVALSGIAEIAGGVGLLWSRTRRPAAIGLILLLLAVFPANIQMLRTHLASGRGGWFEVALWLRLPLQPLLIWWVYRAGVQRARP